MERKSPAMTDPTEAHGPDADSSPAEDLSRSYGAVLEQETWAVDLPADPGPAAQEIEAATPAAPPPLARILEALLFVGGAPLTVERARNAIRGLTPEQFSQALDELNRAYRREGRPYAIQSQAHGYVMALRPRFRTVVEQLYGQTREARLSPAAIDVLALVAYRQPVTKQEVDSIRGAESGGVLRQLVRRGLIVIVQRGEAGQREVSYGTTPRFLELFKLSSLDDLPQTQDLQKL
jgi:segregation and condensation protein B